MGMDWNEFGAAVLTTAVAVLAALLLSLTGCAAPAGAPSFWTQKTQLNAVGLNIVTEFGLINAGTITWSRNVDQPPNAEKLGSAIKAAKP